MTAKELDAVLELGARPQYGRDWVKLLDCHHSRGVDTESNKGRCPHYSPHTKPKHCLDSHDQECLCAAYRFIGASFAVKWLQFWVTVMCNQAIALHFFAAIDRAFILRARIVLEYIQGSSLEEQKPALRALRDCPLRRASCICPREWVSSSARGGAFLHERFVLQATLYSELRPVAI